MPLQRLMMAVRKAPQECAPGPSVCPSVCHPSLSLSLSISPFIFISCSFIKHRRNTRLVADASLLFLTLFKRIEYCCLIELHNNSLENAFSLFHRSLAFSISWTWALSTVPPPPPPPSHFTHSPLFQSTPYPLITFTFLSLTSYPTSYPTSTFTVT